MLWSGCSCTATDKTLRDMPQHGSCGMSEATHITGHVARRERFLLNGSVWAHLLMQSNILW